MSCQNDLTARTFLTTHLESVPPPMELSNASMVQAYRFSLERKYITNIESSILKKVIDKQVIQAADIKEFYKGKADAEVSRQIRKLIDRKLLAAESERARKYIIRFDNNYLLRGIINSLGERGFLPVNE